MIGRHASNIRQSSGPRSTRQADTASIWTEFPFVPEELTTKCRSLIERHHGIHGYLCLPDMLWQSDSRRFVMNHRELRQIFKKASMARSLKRANCSLLCIATVTMALEILMRDFAAWGTQFPDARQNAEKLLGASLTRRAWFMDAYLSTSDGFDRAATCKLAPSWSKSWAFECAAREDGKQQKVNISGNPPMKLQS